MPGSAKCAVPMPDGICGVAATAATLLHLTPMLGRIGCASGMHDRCLAFANVTEQS